MQGHYLYLEVTSSEGFQSLTLDIGEGFVTNSFLTNFGFLNNDIVAVSLDHKGGLCEQVEVLVTNPLPKSSGACVLHQRQLKSKSHVMLKPIDDLEYIDLYCSDSSFPNFSDDVIYVGAETAFNICQRQPVLFQLLMQKKRCTVIVHSLAVIPSAVESIVVSPVKLPVEIENKCYDRALLQFFSTPRLLNVGDLFSITLDQNILRQVGVIKQSLQLWFTVLSLDREGKHIEVGIISRLSTSLTTKGLCNAYVTSHNRTELWEIFSDYGTKIDSSPPVCYPQQHSLRSTAKLLRHLIVASLCGSRPAKVAVILFGPAETGRSVLLRGTCNSFGMHLVEVNCSHLSGESVAATEKRLSILFSTVVSAAPAFLVLHNVDNLCKDRDGDDTEIRLCTFLKEQLSLLPSTIFVVATATCNQATIHRELLRIFPYVRAIEPPNEDERKVIIDKLLSDYIILDCVSLSQLSKRTAGMFIGDLQALVSYTFQNALNRRSWCIQNSGRSHLSCPVHSSILQVHSCEDAWNSALKKSSVSINIVCVDVEKALERLVSEKSVHLNLPKVPQVSWDDVGGLVGAKKDILDTIQLPMQYPELVAKGLRRSGILFYGPPGCGKTLLAKAVATELTLNFMSVKGPELLNMYVGQSEENVRSVFTTARNSAPCIVFFDELDSLAPLRGRSGDSGGVMDRVVSQLLAELDGLHDSADIFVIGATNRPDLLDPALLRPGRFDKMVYIGVSDTKIDRLRILKALTKNITLDVDVKLEIVEEMCPTGLTGADFSSIISDALMNACRRVIHLLESKNDIQNTVESKPPLVCLKDVSLAIDNLKHSVSQT